jgi:hypothetical protein
MYLIADYRGPEETMDYLRQQQEEVMPFLQEMLEIDAEAAN